MNVYSSALRKGVVAGLCFVFLVLEGLPLSLSVRGANALTGHEVGVLSLPGQQDRYRFTLEEPGLFLFDSITNVAGLSWSLAGPTGLVVNGRGFDASDASGIDTPVLRLPRGDYQLTVAGSGDAVGGYEFYFVNLAAAQQILPGAVISRTLTPGGRTDLFQFTAEAGDQVRINALTGTLPGGNRVSFVDPYGSVVYRDTFRTSGTILLPRAGTWTLVVEGALGSVAPTPYSFSVELLGNVPQSPLTGVPMALGVRVTGNLAAPAQTNDFLFTLSAGAQVVLDSLTDNSQISWTLTGPPGAFADQWRLSSVDAERAAVTAFDLGPGTYQVRVRNVGGATGPYEFRLLDLSTAAPITPGVTNFGTNTPARTTSLYRFAANAGDAFYFDTLAFSGFGTTPYWRLFDPYGREVWRAYLDTDIDTLRLGLTGAYTLSVEGAVSDTAASGNYSFIVRPADDAVQSLALGQTVTGTLSTGRRQIYSFSVPQVTRVVMDSLTDESRLVWSLRGPPGLLVDRRAIGSSDASRSSDPTLILLPGDYTLTVDGNGNAAAGYQFRLLDLGAATPLALDTQVNGVLAPARTTVAYQFSIAAPTTVFLDAIGYTGFSTQPFWRVVDVAGHDAFRGYFADSGRFTLAAPGSYTLLVEGDVYDSGVNAGFTFIARSVADATLPLSMGDMKTGTLSVGQVHHYAFSLDHPVRALFDSFVDRSELRWTLSGPVGTVVNRVALGNSDAERRPDAVLSLPAGTYDLAIGWDGDFSGDYQFRLLDLAAAAPIVPGSPVAGTNSPAKSMSLFKFQAAAGDRFFFDTTQVSGFLSVPYWQLFDPAGRLVFATDFGDVDTLAVGSTGTYTIAVQGRVYDTAPSGRFGFQVVPVSDVTAPASPGDLLTGTVAVGQRRLYTFLLNAPALLCADALTDDDRISWTLQGPRGLVVSRLFRYSDGDRWNSVMGLVAGAYTLTVDSSGDVALPYGLRLLDLASATPVTVGTVVTGQASPARSTRLYRFHATAGDRVLFSPQPPTGFTIAPSVRIIAPNGSQVFTSSGFGESDTLLLGATGDYVVMVEGSVSDPAATGSFGFQLYPVQDAATALIPGNTVSGNLAVGQVVSYPFTVVTPKLFYFDSLSDRGDIMWKLVGTPGEIASSRAFAYSDASRVGALALYLFPGDYQVVVDGAGQASGAYAFRLLDADAATPITPGTPVSGGTTPARATAQYRFTAAAGDYYQFDAQGYSGLGQSQYAWRLVNAYGQTVFRQGFTDLASVGPLLGGAHTLYVEGEVGEASPGANFTFNVLFQSNSPPASAPGTPLVFGSPVSGNLATAAQRDVYTFIVATATRLHYDEWTQNPNIVWSLDGPNGHLVDNRRMGDGEFQVYAYPGTFRLTVSANNGATGPYQFQLLDLAAALPLTLGVAVTNTVSPARAGMAFGFDLPSDQRVYLDWLGRSGFQQSPWLQVVTPYGRLVNDSYADASSGYLTLPKGHQTLLVLGLVGDPAASGTFRFRVTPASEQVLPMVLGSPVSGSIDKTAASVVYTFSLGAQSRLYFDSMLSTQPVGWALDGPYGRMFARTSFSSGDQLLNLPPGDYRLTVDADGNATGPYAFRLFDLPGTATPVALDVPFSITNTPASSTTVLRFDGVAGQKLYGNFGQRGGFQSTPWVQLFDPAGNQLYNQYIGDIGPLLLPLTGSYLLALEGLVTDAAASGYASFQLTSVNDADTPLVIDTILNASIDRPTQVNTHSFTLASSTRVFFDLIDYNSSLSWKLDGPYGNVVSPRGFNAGDWQGLLPPGTYRVTVQPGDEWVGAYRFWVRDMAGGAAPIPFNSVIAFTNTPAASAMFRSFQGTRGQRVYAHFIGRSGFVNTPWWQLYDPYGTLVFDQYANADVGPVSLNFDGTYLLAVEGFVSDSAPQGSGSFNIMTPVNTSATATFGTVQSGNLNVMGLWVTNTFTLDHPTRLLFDFWTQRTDLYWAIDGPLGRVASGDFGNDFGPVTLPAGAYQVALTAAAGVTSPYEFRILDVGAAPVLPFGTRVSVTNTPANAATVFQFQGTEGDRLYFNALARSGGTPNWRLSDPYNHTVFDQGAYADAGPLVLPNTGSFVLVIGPGNNQGSGTLTVDFEADQVPLSPPQDLLEPTLTVDLRVSNLIVTPASGIHAGGPVTVQWRDVNSGGLEASGSWQDRVMILNSDLNQVLATLVIPYDSAAPGNGPIPPNGGQRGREVTLNLPDGPAAAGLLEAIVMVDSGNVISEQNPDGIGESNNSSAVSFTSALPGYPDLQVTGITATPAPGWAAGSSVVFGWRLTNSTATPVGVIFHDAVLVRNVTTSAVLTNALVAYEPGRTENGAIAGGSTRDRQLAVVIPGDANGQGLFEITVTADSAGEVFEYAPGVEAEQNNAQTAQFASAPDLQVEQLTTVGAVRAGSNLTVRWNVANHGNAPVVRTFVDSLVIRNTARNETLLNTAVQVNVADPRTGPIPAGSFLPREYVFRLPDGPSGAGSLEISVTTDSTHVVAEYSGLNPAEQNNNAVINPISDLPPYPDLQVRNLGASPAAPQSGREITLQWEDLNAGDGPTTSGWSDRVQVLNVTRGTQLLDTRLVYDAGTLGALPAGGSVPRQVVYRLPDGDPGTGVIRFTVTVDGTASVFEYAASVDAEANNTAFVERTSSLAPYPDLQVTGLAVSPGSLGSGRNVTISWITTNTGAVAVTGDFYDRVLVVNRTTSQTLLDTRLYLNPGADAAGPIAPGQSRSRSQVLRLPDGIAGAGDIQFQVTTDDGNRIFEYLAGGDGEANNAATLNLTSVAGVYPDLVLTGITAPSTGIPGQPVQISWTVRNDGATNTTGAWNDQVFLSEDAVVGDDVSLGLFSVSGTLAPGDSMSITQSVTLPFFATGTQRLIVRVNAGQTFFEPNFANNLLMDDQAIALSSRLALTVSRTEFPESGGPAVATLTVTRNSGVSSPATVTLFNSNPGTLVVPASLALGAGQASASVPIGVIDNTLVDGNRTVTLTASAGGVDSDPLILTVDDDDRSSLQLQLTPAVVSEAAGDSGVVGYLTRNAGLSQPLTVALASSAVNKLLPPATVSFPAGESVVTFNVAVPDNEVLEGTATVTLQAAAAGFASGSASVDVLDNDIPVLSIALVSDAVSEGAPSPATTGTLTRSPVTGRDLRVSLGQAPLGALLLPASVVIPAGQASASFNINTLDDSQVSGTRLITLTAQPVADTGTVLTNTVSRQITLYDNDGPTLTLELASDVVSEQGTVQGTVTRNTATGAPLVVSLSSSDTTEATVPPAVTIPAGAASAAFTAAGVQDGITDGVQYTILTAAAAGYNSANARLNVTDVDLPDLEVGNIIVPSSGQTDSGAEVTWSVSNTGLAAASGSWTDRVYISTDDQLGNDILAASVPATGPLAPGASYTRTRSILLPSQPGHYHVIVVTDADNQVAEGSERNNVISVATIEVQPSYRATIQALVKQAPCGTPIPMKGRAYFVDDNSPAPFRTLTVRIRVRDTRRVQQVVTDDKGEFTFTFTPLPTEAGVYTVAVDHPLVQEDTVQDTFTLLGFRPDPEYLGLRVVPNEARLGSITLNNLSDQPLHGLQAVSDDAPQGLNLLLTVPGYLPGNGSVSLQYVLNPSISGPASFNFTLRVTTDEQVVKVIPCTVVVSPLRPVIAATPGFLDQGMVRGTQTLVTFEVRNTGGAPSGELNVLAPAAPWLAVASGTILGSLQPGEKATVTLALNPAADLPLTVYDGAIAVGNTSAGVTLPFHFRAISEARGDLRVLVTDEYTYFVSSGPRVTNALVTLRDPVTGLDVASARSDATGVALFTNQREGSYIVDASAERHAPYRGTARVVPGTTTELEAFLSRQTVTYQWSVVPLDVQDQYRVVLQSVFETEVPIPNVVVEQPFMMPFVIEGQTNQFDIKIRNEGLIAANGVKIDVPQDPRYIITPLVEEIGVLPAKSAMTIPVTIRLRNGATPPPAPELASLDALRSAVHPADGGGGCEVEVHACLPNIPMGVHYYYVCGPNNVLQVRQIDLSPVCVAHDVYECYQSLRGAGEAGFEGGIVGASCEFLEALLTCGGADLSECQEAALQMACRTIVGGITGGAAGAGAGAASGLGGSLGCICSLVSDWMSNMSFTPPPPGPPPELGIGWNGWGQVYFVPLQFGPGLDGGGSQGCRPPAAPPGPSLADASTSPGAVCARVKLEIEQHATLTRAAFRGTLGIENAGTVPITALQVSLDFRDESGADASSRFVIRGPDITGLGAVDGTGTVPAGGGGAALYTFIPTRDAAPDAPRNYRIGGTIRYVENGQLVTVPLLSEPILVYPDARLALKYFQSRDVFSDDPFTDVVEPAEPFYLGLLVHNAGAGIARNFRITSAQPRIIENQKGLLVNFQIIGSRVGAAQVAPSLEANLGDIPAGGSQVAEWVLTSSLQGKFIDYKATFEHVDNLGATNLSLIDSVEVHELIHPVLADRAGDDALPDFLCNDVPDAGSQPDTLYMSDGSTAEVLPATGAVVSGTITLASRSVHLTATQPAGWSYLELPDPGAGFRLWKVIRSDGKALRVGDNAWTTDRTFPSSLTGAVRENKLHLLDYNGNGDYTVYYRPNDSVPPSIASMDVVAPSVAGGPVTQVAATFSEEIEVGTLGPDDLTLTRNGATVALGGPVTWARDGAAFRYVATLPAGVTSADGNYQVVLNAAGIEDLAGNTGAGTAAVQWSRGVNAPVVAAVGPVSPAIRNTPVDQVDVVFSRGIDAFSFDVSDVVLTRDGALGNLIGPALSVRAVSPDHYVLEGLAAVTQAPGRYTLTVLGSGVSDAQGVGGLGSLSASWRMLTQGPRVAAIQALNDNPRSVVVPSLDITFDTPIDAATFTWEDVQLTRNGGGNLITPAVSVTRLDDVTYRVANFNWVVGLEGTYAFSVSAADVRDLAGNPGQGTVTMTWVMDTTKPGVPVNLAMVPDRGVSATDQVLNTLRPSLTGDLPEPGIGVKVVDLTSQRELGVATSQGTHFVLPLDLQTPGAHRLRVYAVDAAANLSSDVILDVFVDLVPPTATIAGVAPSPRDTAVASVDLTFSEPVNTATFTAADVSLRRNGGGNLVGPTVGVVPVSGNTYRITGLESLTDTPGVYVLAVDLKRIEDVAGNPGLDVATTQWSRRGPNTAPVLTPVPDFAAIVGSLVTFTNNATDAELGTQTLTYSLDAGAPPNAHLTPDTGVFTWRPTRSQAPGVYSLTVRVTDSGVPALSDARTFTVSVGDYSEVLLGKTAVEPGDLGLIPIQVTSTAGLTNLAFDVSFPAGKLADFSLSGLGPLVGSSSFHPVAADRIRITLGSQTGQAIRGANLLGYLSFRAASPQDSAFLVLPVSNVETRRPNGDSVPAVFVGSGHVVVVGDQPLLEALMEDSSGERYLELHGKPGQAYDILWSQSVGLGAPWIYDRTVVPASLTEELHGLDPSRAVVFYRAVPAGAAGPSLLATRRVDGNLDITVRGRTGAVYRLMSSPVVGPGASWTFERTVTLTQAAETITITAPASGVRFYRLEE